MDTNAAGFQSTKIPSLFIIPSRMNEIQQEKDFSFLGHLFPEIFSIRGTSELERVDLVVCQ